MSAVVAPFLRRPIPVAGESIYGFERRFAACTRYESLGSFREATGLFEIVPGSLQAKFARLAMLAGRHPNDLDAMRWTGQSGGKRGCSAVFLGHLIRTTYLRTEQLRFCPTCLAEDGAPEQRLHLQAWQILQICACPKHGTLLLEACDDCGKPIEQALKTKAWSCNCGREMTEMTTIVAPQGAVAMSLSIIRRLDRRTIIASEAIEQNARLTEPFASLGFDDLLTVVSKIGILASAPRECDAPTGQKDRPYTGVAFGNEISCTDAAGVMDAADRIVHDWPKAMEAIFSCLADRNPDPCDDHPVRSIFSTQAGYRLLGRLKSVEGGTISVIDDALESWLLNERGIYIDGRQRPRIGVADDVAIDKADALRRLEGRSGHPLSIRAWSAAGAIEMVGSYVSLNSVEATVNKIFTLASSEFGDSMSVGDWSSRFLFHKHYRCSDAIRDVLSGRIRVRRLIDLNLHGLASIEISSDDFLRCTQEAATLASSENRSVARRAERARKIDGFCRSGQLYALLMARWPECPMPDVAKETGIRCRTDIRRYYGRDMKQQLYSIVDALDLMEARHSSVR